MKSLTEILKEAVRKSGNADQDKLLNFIEANKDEFESASDNEIAVAAILDSAVADNTITREEKNILSAAVSIFFTNGENLSGSIKPAIDKAVTSAAAKGNNLNPSPENSAAHASGAGWRILKFGTYTANTTGGLIWLLTLYVGATWLAIGSLSSIQFRDDIENKYHTTLNQMKALRGVQEEVIQYRTEKNDEISEWENHLKAIANAISEKPENFTSFLDAIKKLRCSGQATTDVCIKLGKTLDDYLSLLEKKRSKEEALLKNIDDFEKNNNLSNNASKPAIKQDELLSRIEFMKKFQFGDMLAMPDQVLTLLLAIAMGVLGSTITMTWTFLSEKPNPPFKWYLLRPFVGALSALVLFIFAKAGQMTLTADVNNGGSLSPFVLSLFGIAAGLMSDRAYAQMSSVSGKVLGDVGAEQPRWSSHLKDELEKKNITADQLAADLNLDKHQINEIVACVRAASAKEQQRISDRLGIHPRLLFTDIQP